MSDFTVYIGALAARFESHFAQILPEPRGLEARVVEALRYAALGGGKRLRPFFVIETAKMLGYEDIGVWDVAAALEAIHVYSLVHDDLPCMDDDDMRRGKPTVHRAYDEATAVLAGDALLTLAFQIMVSPHVHSDAAIRLDLISDLARAAGHKGMIGGQMIDLTMDSHPQTEQTITRLQNLKTGALIHYGVVAGARMAGANEAQKTALSTYARHIGLIFQITDDLLDIEGDAQIMGKAAGKDASKGKATFVSILGVDGARAKAHALADEARACLALFGHKAVPLQSVIEFVLNRDK